MKQWLMIGVLAMCCFAWGAAAQAPDLESMDLVERCVPDGPVAFVNGQPIAGKDFIDLYKGQIQLYARQHSGTPVSDTTRIGVAIQTLRQLVERELLRQEAGKRKVTITDAELQAAWKTEIDRLRKALSKGGTQLTEEEVLQQAKASKTQALEDLRKELLIEKMRTELMKEAKVEVSDQEVGDYFIKNKPNAPTGDILHLKHIFISGKEPRPGTTVAGPNPRTQAQQKAQNALQRIRAGQSFDAVAREMSQGQGRDNGGDIGAMPAAELPPFYVTAAAGMQPNQVSDVIESPEGYHIIKLIERKAGEAPSLEKYAPLIRSRLLSEKGDLVVAKFCMPYLADEKVVQEVLLAELERQLRTQPELMEELRKSSAKAVRELGAENKSPAAKPASSASGNAKANPPASKPAQSASTTKKK